MYIWIYENVLFAIHMNVNMVNIIVKINYYVDFMLKNQQ